MEQINKWGFLRETKKAAEKAGVDIETGLHRTSLDEYLAVIFPEIKTEEWIHNKTIPDSGSLIKPDYRCETLKLIIEFDGLRHYQNPIQIIGDSKKNQIYENMGYKVVRIPYFIQLTNEVIEQIFERKVSDPMFNPSIPSMSISGKNTPAFCCPKGIERMAKEFNKFPQQYEVNLIALEKADNEFLTGADLLRKTHENLSLNLIKY